MKEKVGCELLIKARALAIKRGLDSDKVQCPVIDWCKGEKCHMIDSDDMDGNYQMIDEEYDNKLDRG